MFGEILHRLMMIYVLGQDHFNEYSEPYYNVYGVFAMPISSSRFGEDYPLAIPVYDPVSPLFMPDLYTFTATKQPSQPALEPAVEKTTPGFSFPGVKPLLGSYYWFSKVHEIQEDGAQPYKSEQGPPEAQISGTTEFMADAECEETTPVRNVNIPTAFINTQPYDSAFLNEWFAKPIRVASGDLTLADTATSIPPIVHPNNVLSNEIYSSKWKGYAYWRGDITYSVTVNANPFQQGLYRLAFLSNGGMDDSVATSWYNAHYFSVVQRSQLPHVEVDVSTTTCAELTVPFISAYNSLPLSYPTISSFASLGRVYLFPITPITTGVGQPISVGYTIWASMSNVHLEVPAYPQSAIRSGKKKPSTESEQKSKGIGPVESGLRIASKVSNILGAIPVLSAFAGPASWALDIAGNVAGAFGWAKPANLDVTGKMQKDVMWGMQHTDASDNSKIMALVSTNQVEVLPGYAGTDLDELALDSFLTRESYIDYFDWNYAMDTNTKLAEIKVSPFLYRSYNQDGIINFCNTPMSFMARNFKYWRGDIIIRFHIVKTNMHSGRLAFVYQPNSLYITPIAPTMDQSVYNWREIVDVRTNNIVEFRIPYHFFRAYRPNYDIEHDYSGLLTVYVVDELVGPSSVNTNVTINYYVRAAPGFEFAVPRSNFDHPVFGQSPIAAPQSNITGTPGKTMKSAVIGNAVPFNDPDNLAARYCIGEKITSLRQLLRNTRILKMINGTSPAVTSDFIAINPFLYHVANKNPTIGADQPYYGADLMSQLGSMFALSRGGVRVKSIHLGGGIVTASLRVSDTTGPVAENTLMRIPKDPITHDSFSDLSGVIVAISSSSDRAGAEFTVPAYAPTHSRSNAVLVTGPNIPTYYSQSAPQQKLFLDYQNATSLEYGRAGADDFDMGCFISIPPVLTSE
jgi:hypothetical protein